MANFTSPAAPGSPTWGATLIYGTTTPNPKAGLGFDSGGNAQLYNADGSIVSTLINALQNGSAASPSIAWANSTGMGWYRAANNQIGVAFAGVQGGLWTASAFAHWGNIQAGKSGTAGSLTSFPASANGSLSLTAVANSGAYANVISNASTGQATTWSAPDPGAATASFLLNTYGGAVVFTPSANGLDITGRISCTTGRFIGGTSQGAAATDSEAVVGKTGIADATATTFATITVPNSQAMATFIVRIQAQLGAGGAVGAGEAWSASSYILTIGRTAGLASVLTVTSQLNLLAGNVTGAATVTATITEVGPTGANSAAQTYNLQITITKSGGASANHTLQYKIEEINAQGSGITWVAV